MTQDNMSELLTLEGLVLRMDKEKSWGFGYGEFEDVGESGKREILIFLPKSQCHYDKDSKRVYAPRWLVDKRDLAQFLPDGPPK